MAPKGSTGHDFAAIASQIKDRAETLAREREICELSKVAKGKAQAEFDQVSKRNIGFRRKLLKSLRSRHGIELELFRVNEQQDKQREKVTALKEEAKVLESQAKNMEMNWKRTVDELYASHQAKRELYQHCLERRIFQRQQHTQMLKNKTNFWERRASEMKADEKDLISQKENFLVQAKEADNREIEEDEAVSSLALQIKATLTKVRYTFGCRQLINTNLT